MDFLALHFILLLLSLFNEERLRLLCKRDLRLLAFGTSFVQSHFFCAVWMHYFDLYLLASTGVAESTVSFDDCLLLAVIALGGLGQWFVLFVLHLPSDLLQTALAEPIKWYFVDFFCLLTLLIKFKLSFVLMFLTSLLVVSFLRALHISKLQLLNYKLTSTKWKVAKMKKLLHCGLSQTTQSRRTTLRGYMASRVKHRHWSRRKNSWQR